LISIHAPVKGATASRSSHHRHTISHFNPRTREGCDNNTKPGEKQAEGFQSTHP